MQYTHAHVWSIASGRTEAKSGVLRGLGGAMTLGATRLAFC